MVGDAVDPPTIYATSAMNGIGVFDSDPYIPNGYGLNWFQNQNNFWRQVRNFIFDLRDAPKNCAGIHWQVAQATSLQNLKFIMRNKNEPQNKQQGVRSFLGPSKSTALTLNRSSWKTGVEAS